MSYRNDNSDEVLDGFNPFATNEPIRPSASTSTPRPVFSPAILPETPKANLNKNDKLYREIEDREKALQDLENKIQKREEELQKRDTDTINVSLKNFPPFPRFCPCRPCFYQDFDVEIADEYRGIVKLAYYIWIVYALVLFVNIFGTLSYLIINNGDTSSFTLFGVSILMFLLMPLLGYLLWFRPLYKAFRSQSSINFFTFFLFFLIVIILIIIQLLGFNNLGSCGWIISLTVIHKNIGVAAFMLVISCAFTILAILAIFLYIKVHRTYRITGASFNKAKAEMVSKGVTTALHH